MMRFGTGTLLALVLLGSLLLVGCGGTSSEYDEGAAADTQAAAEQAAEAVAPEALDVTPELAAILAAADAADGESDNVVSQCTNCGLAMEGVADHAVNVGEYELYFCSEGCLEAFSDNAEARLLALDIKAVENGANQVEIP